jgi:hypothetical protein
MNSRKAQSGVSSGRFSGARSAGALTAEGLPKNVAEAIARAAIERFMTGMIKDLCISVGRSPLAERYVNLLAIMPFEQRRA